MGDSSSPTNSPKDSDEEVIVLSDSSLEDDELHSPTLTPKGSSSGNSWGGGGNESDSDTNSDITVMPRTENGGDILMQVVQLIDWINSYEANRDEAAGSSSVKKKFRDGFIFIEGLQNRFEDNQNVIAVKEERMAEVMGEYETLKNQLQSQQTELDKLRRRNIKLEEDRRQRKKEALPIARIRRKVAKLQEFFNEVIRKLEHEPVNPMDPSSVHQREEVDVFKREVGGLFLKVMHKLNKWETDQRGLEGELESTNIVLHNLNEMVMVKEKFRSMNKAATSVTPVPPPPVIPSVVPVHPSITPGAGALAGIVQHQSSVPMPPTGGNANGVGHSKKRKRPPPPALLPLPATRKSTTCQAPSISPQSPGAENIPQKPSTSRKTASIQHHQQQKEMDSLVRSMTALHAIPPKASTSTAPNIGAAQFQQETSSSLSADVVPPLPPLNFPLPSVKPQPMVRPIDKVAQGITPKITKPASATITRPPVMPASLPMQQMSTPTPAMPSTSVWPMTSNENENSFATVTKPLQNSSSHPTSTWTAAASSVSSSHPPPRFHDHALGKKFNVNSFPPRTNSVIRQAATVMSCSGGGSPIPATKHSLPPLRLLTSSKEVPVPVIHQREAIEIFGGPSTSPPQAKPKKGLNVCGLCGMSFKSLVQMKLHHSVMHSKGPLPGTSALTALKPLMFPARQNATVVSERATPPPQPSAVTEPLVPPVRKRICLAPNPSFSANVSFPSVSRSSTLTSLGDSPSSSATFGRLPIPPPDIAIVNSTNFSSNENSGYPINFQ